MPEATAQAAEVVAEVRADGAAIVAEQAVAATAAETAIVVEAVAQVDEALADHAEASEERHVEILEGEEWLRNQIGVFTGAQAAQTALLMSLQAQLTAGLELIQSRLQSLNESQGLPPSTPTTPQSLPVVEPEPAKGGPEESEKTTTESNKPEETPPSKRRKRQVL